MQENERFVYGHIGENLKVVEHPAVIVSNLAYNMFVFSGCFQQMARRGA